MMMNVKLVMRNILNKQLAHAFIIARHEGFVLCVRMIDGTSINDGRSVRDPERVIDVIVHKGMVKKSWKHEYRDSTLIY